MVSEGCPRAQATHSGSRARLRVRSGSAATQLALGLGTRLWLGTAEEPGAAEEPGTAEGEADGAGSGAKPSWTRPASRTGSVPARALLRSIGTSGWRPLPWIQTLSGVSQRATVRWMPPKLLGSGSHSWTTPLP
jgi:hypothetical protein